MNSSVVEWIPTEEACQRLGKSSKTVERLAATGELETKMEPVPGRKSRRVFSAAAIERLAQEWDEQKRMRRAELTAGPRTHGMPTGEVLKLVERITATSDKTAMTVKPVVLWLTERQAREYSQLSRRDLRSLAEEGTLKTRQNGRQLRYQRRSLEVFSRS